MNAPPTSSKTLTSKFAGAKLFRQPGRVVFAKQDVQKSRGRQNIHGQSAVPQCHAEPELALPREIDLVFVDGHFEDALERDFRDGLGIQEAHEALLDRESLNVAAHQID